MKILVILTIVFTLAACGGGGSGASSSDTTQQSHEQNQQLAQQQNEQEQADESFDELVNDSIDEQMVEPISTANLVAEEHFEFQSISELNIYVDITHRGEQVGYLNICNIEEGEIDFKNCYVNAPVRNGVFSSQIAVAADVTALGAEVVFFDENVEPLRAEWHAQNGGDWYIQ